MISRRCFWRTKHRCAVLKPLLPNDTRGKPRVDDQRVISGIIQVLKSGGAGIDAPEVYMLEQMPRSAILHGDKGYDSDAIRRQVEGKGAMPNIPPKANRHWKNCFSPVVYIEAVTPSSVCSVA